MKKKYSFFKNASYALLGLKRAFKESAFLIEFIIMIPLFIFTIFYPFELLNKAFLIACLLLVLMTECINTAIESVVDLATSKYNKLAKDAKDLGSAAVFISISIATIIWLTILYTEIFKDLL